MKYKDPLQLHLIFLNAEGQNIKDVKYFIVTARIIRKIKDSILVTGGPKQTSKIKEEIFSEYIKISNNSSNVRKFGSAALDMAYVACGRFDGYWQREINLWDVAAGIVLVKEAGGFVDFFEEESKLSLKKNVLATNSSIHGELRDLISKKSY